MEDSKSENLQQQKKKERKIEKKIKMLTGKITEEIVNAQTT